MQQERILLVAVSTTLLVVGTAYAAFEFDFNFGSSGTGDGQFNNPSGIEVNSTHIIVLEESGKRVQIFDLSGNFEAKFGSSGTGDGQFDVPLDLAVNSTHILVADTGNDRVQIFDLSGNFEAKFSVFFPRGIAQNSTHILVSRSTVVEIFDHSGNLVDSFGSSGTGDGQFDIPHGITLNEDNIFVADSGNDRVQIFDLSGNFVTKFGSTGTGDGQFSLPVDIEVDEDNIFVADSGNDRVQIFDLSGNFVEAVGESGTGDGQLDNPRGVAVNSLFVTERANDRVSVFSVSSSEGSDGGGDGCRGDCQPPTLGVDSEGKRIVTGGFSYNGHSTDVQYYYTPYPLITVTTGDNNTAAFKIYDNMGPDNIVHLSFAFGLGQDQVISQSKAAIELDIAFDGTHTVSVTDPENALDNINVTTSTGNCTDGSASQCLIVTIRHSFREQLDFNMVGTDVWDSSRNSWQNYYNHGIHVTGESLNPPDQYNGIHKGHIYHLTETGKGTAVDEFGNTWTYDKRVWIKDFVKNERPEDDAWKVMNRYHSGFAQYKEGQIPMAVKALTEHCPLCMDEKFEEIGNIASIPYPEQMAKLQDPLVLIKMEAEENLAKEKLGKIFHSLYRHNPYN